MYRTREQLKEQGYKQFDDGEGRINSNVWIGLADDQLLSEIVVFEKSKKKPAQWPFTKEKFDTYKHLSEFYAGLISYHKFGVNTNKDIIDVIAWYTRLDLTDKIG